MYDPISGELDSQIAKLPESLEQPRVMDLVVGQYALLDVEAIWVNEEGEVRVDNTYPIDTRETTIGSSEYVRIVKLMQGIVIDAVDLSDGVPMLFARTPLADMTKDDHFDISAMEPVVWMVANTVQRDMLHLIYKRDIGGELYYEHSAAVKKTAKVKPAKQKPSDAADKSKGQGESTEKQTEE